MVSIIKGLLAQNLPWAPIFVGVFLGCMAQMMGGNALSWAVGTYLPLSTTLPIWIGGLLKGFVEKLSPQPDSTLSPGMLYSTGLVAGGSLGGVLIALVAFTGDSILRMEKPTLPDKLDVGSALYPGLKSGTAGDILCALVFAGLCLLLVKNARKNREA